jgi:F-type H+-transporting ATPase subunit b
MPQISQIAATYASQIFWLLVTFGILYFGIGKVMVPRVIATVDAREGQIAADLAAAEQARLAADQVEAAWRLKMDEARAAALAETTAAKAQAAKASESQIRSAMPSRRRCSISRRLRLKSRRIWSPRCRA